MIEVEHVHVHVLDHLGHDPVHTHHPALGQDHDQNLDQSTDEILNPNQNHVQHHPNKVNIIIFVRCIEKIMVQVAVLVHILIGVMMMTNLIKIESKT